MFSGSYLESDVSFLLKVIDIPFTSVEEKESLIQTKNAHYSEMLSPEYEPSEAYLKIFYQAFERNKERFAQDILTLAENISCKKDIVLISLVRAGTPIGVLLKRTLMEIFQKEVPHYSISIIRDREIDQVALHFIVTQHPEYEPIFVDGWTGKGVINRELKNFIGLFNEIHDMQLSDALYVVSDIAGVAEHASTGDDYLIPSSSLNSTISGLVSRSILNDTYIKEGDFHGCRYYREYAEGDLSLWFIDEMMKMIATLKPSGRPLIQKNHNRHIAIGYYFHILQERYGIKDINHIKPGIGESTRVLLRRVPYIVLVKETNSPEVAHLLLLASEKQVQVEEDPTLPFTALAIIKEVV